MARTQLNYLVTTSIGTTLQVVNDATVTVRKASDGTLATLYAGITGGTTVLNPLTADSSGRVSAWVDIGKYLLVIEGPGLTTYSEYKEAIPADQLYDIDSAGERLDVVEDKVADIDTSDVTMDDAVAINVPATKKRRVPIADKAVYDLREFYSGTSQPANVLGHIHDGLAKTAVAGGSLLIPDSEEPWDINGPIVPPPNSRMHGPSPLHFNVRGSASGHGSQPYQLPVLPNSLGEAYIRLIAGSNCPILQIDYDDSEGKRGPSYGGNGYWQWFTAMGIAFDHNGRNQSGALIAIDVRDSWGVNFPWCRLIEPRGLGVLLDNCNECNGFGFTSGGELEDVANGVGDINGTTTVSNASGTWAQGDYIRALAGVAIGTYVTNVAGSTLTLSTPATATATATALTKRTQTCTGLLVMRNTTTDCEWQKVSMHGGAPGLLIDSAFGNRVSGLFGYAIGGPNVWLRDTYGGLGTFVNKLDLRLEQATKHNLRIDSGVKDNTIDVVAYRAGIKSTPADADNGWCNVFCDGKNNVLRGSGFKGTAMGLTPSQTNVVGYGPNATDNRGEIGGGSDLTAGTRIYRYETGASLSNSNPAPPPFVIPVSAFVPVEGSLRGRGISRPVTAVAGTDLFTATAHGLIAGQEVVFWGLTGGANIAAGTPYYVIASGLTANDFKVSTTVGGSTIDVTSDLTSGTLLPPVLQHFNGQLHRALAFQDGVTESAVAYLTMPYGVRKVLIRPECVNLNIANSGNAEVQIGIMDATAGQTLAGDETTVGPAAIGFGTNLQIQSTTFTGTQWTVVPGDMFALKFRRIGADAGDAITSQIGLVGVRIEPVLVA